MQLSEGFTELKTTDVAKPTSWKLFFFECLQNNDPQLGLADNLDVRVLTLLERAPHARLHHAHRPARQEIKVHGGVKVICVRVSLLTSKIN